MVITKNKNLAARLGLIRGLGVDKSFNEEKFRVFMTFLL